MSKIIKVINEDIIQMGDKYIYSDDRYKYGRSYEPISKEEAEEKIKAINKPWNEKYNIREIEDKKGYIVNSCSHSNGETTDFFMKIDSNIYMCSYVDFKYGMIDISVNYNIDTNEFEMDENEYAITTDEVDDFIFQYAKKFY